MPRMWGIGALRPLHVIASEKKQSIVTSCTERWIASLRRGLLRCARNDGWITEQHRSSYPRRRVSSTPRLFGSITAVSGILGHPPSRVTTTECAFAFSRRTAPDVCMNWSPPSRSEGAGNAGCLLHPRSRVQCGDRGAHEHTGTAGARRHSLRNGLTAYAALSLETNSSCLHHCRLDGSIDPVGSKSPPAAWHQPRVSGPHGFAVRMSAVRPARRAPLTGWTCPAATLRADALASTASRLAFVTIAIRPSCRDGTARK